MRGCTRLCSAKLSLCSIQEPRTEVLVEFLSPTPSTDPPASLCPDCTHISSSSLKGELSVTLWVAEVNVIAQLPRNIVWLLTVHRPKNACIKLSVVQARFLQWTGQAVAQRNCQTERKHSINIWRVRGTSVVDRKEPAAPSAYIWKWWEWEKTRKGKKNKLLSSEVAVVYLSSTHPHH